MKKKNRILIYHLFIMAMLLTTNNSCKKDDAIIKKDLLPTNGLVAYYPLNGNVNDNSGNGNHGSQSNLYLDYDRHGNLSSAYFNGIDSYFEVPHNPTLNFGITKDFSFCLWIKPEYTESWNSLISKGTSESPIYQLAIRDGYLVFESGSSTEYFVSNTVFDLNQWYFCVVAIEHSAGRVKFFINGQLDKTIIDSSITNYNFSSEATLKFGIERWLISQFFYNGNMDDIRIYNRVLTENEIQQLYKE
jgi:hypothetical protein